MSIKTGLKTRTLKIKYFLKNKSFLSQKLEYLRLIYLLTDKKSLRLLFDILKFAPLHLKLKLLFIYFLPRLVIRLKYKYL